MRRVDTLGNADGIIRRYLAERLHVGTPRKRAAATLRQHSQQATRGTAHQRLVAPLSAGAEGIRIRGRGLHRVNLTAIGVDAAPPSRPHASKTVVAISMSAPCRPLHDGRFFAIPFLTCLQILPPAAARFLKYTSHGIGIYKRQIFSLYAPFLSFLTTHAFAQKCA